MISFKEFLNENKSDRIDTKKLTYQEYLKNIIDSCQEDLGMTKKQSIELTILYRDLFRDAWGNSLTIREAIASTKRPGVIISDDKIEESFLFNIDSTYETYINKIEEEKNSDNIERYVTDYYNKFNKSYSDVRIFERVKNNHKMLTKLADKRLFEMNYTTDEGSVEVDVVERNDDLIDNLINKFSFGYKKKKDRYIRPIKITGKTLPNDIQLEATLSNKDVVKITFDNKDETQELKVHINNKLIYHMDYYDIEDILEKSLQLYENYLIKQNFKLTKKSNPFE